ncbi:hypothetical protein RBU61_08480 [Tissierella sp. MB52-C2]|uniref:hypothetical protein n=1 Tax=Tissierella sp. MB52-C2 TaxID=3070999 RepID=UPI00280BEAFF|nr:hypothetical protein [Tissierella sp. MB52-C2]WMM26701.1 hypothetical protein RBU61_08480 [Tissierella sp. MB52-C2]
MYTIVHFFILRSLVYFNVKNIGFTGFPMPIEELLKSIWFLPVSNNYKAAQIYTLENVGLLSTFNHEYGDENEKRTLMIYLTKDGWYRYHEKKANISNTIFQCIWNVIILLFGYYLGKFS